MIRFRMDRRLANRIDAEDVLQDVFLAAQKRLDNLIQSPTESFLVWIRMITRQTLVDLARHHLGAQRRTTARECRREDFWNSQESFSMASLLPARTDKSSSSTRRPSIENAPPKTGLFE